MHRSPRVAAALAALLVGCAAQPTPHLSLAQAIPAPPPDATAPAPAPVNTGYPMPGPPAPLPSGAPTVEPMPPAIDQQPPAPNMNDVRTRRADPDGRGVLRTAGWVSLAIGIEAALVGIFTGVIMLHDDSVRKEFCPGKVCTTQSGTDANDAIQKLSGWNVGAWTVAALGIGAGAVLLVTTSPTREGKSTSVGLSPSGVLLRSTF